MTEEIKRGVGRPPLAQKPDKREVHLYIPVELAKQADERRGRGTDHEVPMSTYILQLIKDDVKQERGRPRKREEQNHG